MNWLGGCQIGTSLSGVIVTSNLVKRIGEWWVNLAKCEEAYLVVSVVHDRASM